MIWTTQTLLPLAAIAALAILVPKLLARRLPRTLAAVALNLALSAVLLFLAGAAILGGFYLLDTPAIGRELAGNPAGAAEWLARLGLLPVIVWLPILALVTLGIAQKVAGEG